MKIKRGPITFNNVISASTQCNIQEWYHAARDIRNAVIKNGLYGTGPVIYQTSEYDAATNEAIFTFYLPVNMPVQMPDNEKYRFIDQLKFDDGLVLRHADLDESTADSYELLRVCAQTQQLVLQEPFYNIFLDVYGGGIIDIYAPIVKERRND